MSVIGVVENGKVVLPPEAQLPTGTRVRIETLAPDERERASSDTFEDYIGIFDDLPSDLAHNHDHYIHGTSKQ